MELAGTSGHCGLGACRMECCQPTLQKNAKTATPCDMTATYLSAHLASDGLASRKSACDGTVERDIPKVFLRTQVEPSILLLQRNGILGVIALPLSSVVAYDVPMQKRFTLSRSAWLPLPGLFLLVSSLKVRYFSPHSAARRSPYEFTSSLNHAATTLLLSIATLYPPTVDGLVGDSTACIPTQDSLTL